jgi:hypothetical protein
VNYKTLSSASRLCMVWVMGGLLAACNAQVSETDKQPTADSNFFTARHSTVSAIHHLGRGHHIGEFSIDGKACGNAGSPEKNSGSDTMCSIPLPEKWRPGIKMKVKWAVTNWNEDLTGLQKGNAGKWYEAEAELERFTTNYGTEVHFFPNGVVRIVPNLYGPPDSDTEPNQTPPLAEMPIYPPPWEGMGRLMAAFEHEGKFEKDYREFQGEKAAYYAFLGRIWKSRNLSAEEIAANLAKEHAKEIFGLRVGHALYLDRVMARAGYSKKEIKDLTKDQRGWDLAELKRQLAHYVKEIKKKD